MSSGNRLKVGDQFVPRGGTNIGVRWRVIATPTRSEPRFRIVDDTGVASFMSLDEYQRGGYQPIKGRGRFF